MSEFKRDDQVRKKKDTGSTGVVIDGPKRRPGGQAWHVRLPDGSTSWWREVEIELVPAHTSLQSELAAGRFGTSRDFSRLITFHRLHTPLRDNIYALQSTKTDFYPHQFKPLLKFLDNPRPRLLIADEVGLGKTIEAGLILTEMKARGSTARILVVCPKALCVKWRMEMRNRFGEDFAIYENARALEEFLEVWEESGRMLPFHGILSLQGLRLPRMAELIDCQPAGRKREVSKIPRGLTISSARTWCDLVSVQHVLAP